MLGVTGNSVGLTADRAIEAIWELLSVGVDDVVTERAGWASRDVTFMDRRSPDDSKEVIGQVTKPSTILADK